MNVLILSNRKILFMIKTKFIQNYPEILPVTGDIDPSHILADLVFHYIYNSQDKYVKHIMCV